MCEIDIPTVGAIGDGDILLGNSGVALAERLTVAISTSTERVGSRRAKKSIKINRGGGGGVVTVMN